MQAKVARRSFSEGGPAQSLTRFGWQATFSKEIGDSGPISRRLQYFSTPVVGAAFRRPVEQPYR
jgi:hypothetical protein